MKNRGSSTGAVNVQIHTHVPVKEALVAAHGALNELTLIRSRMITKMAWFGANEDDINARVNFTGIDDLKRLISVMSSIVDVADDAEIGLTLGEHFLLLKHYRKER